MKKRYKIWRDLKSIPHRDLVSIEARLCAASNDLGEVENFMHLEGTVHGRNVSKMRVAIDEILKEVKAELYLPNRE